MNGVHYSCMGLDGDCIGKLMLTISIVHNACHCK